MQIDFDADYVDSRTMSSKPRSMVVFCSGSHRISFSNIDAAVVPISCRGVRRLLTGGSICLLPARSLTPMTLRSEEHTSELQALMRISYAVSCLKKKIDKYTNHTSEQ